MFSTTKARRTRQTLAVICLLLISIVSFAQSSHDHANDAKAAQHCSVCFAAHVSLIKSSAALPAPAQVKRAAAITLRESLTSLLLTENSYIRPPPASLS